MRKLILQEFVSVDGFAADNKGGTKFFEEKAIATDGAVDKALLQFIGTIDTILLGANTYRMFTDYWPEATTDKDLVADELNKTPKVVFSSSLQEAPWGKWEPAEVVSTDAVATVKHLKQQPGKDMVVWGSISLAQSLMEAGLFDEIQLWVVPVTLGKGRPLFNNSKEMDLQETKTFDPGVLFLRYSL